MKKCVLAAVAVAGMIPAVAFGQWSDNFDSYMAGSINGQGGWQGWDNVPAAAGTVVTAVARSSPHSQRIDNGSDSVQRFTDVTSGQWSLVAWQFIPQNYSGNTYFIVNNQYNDGGPYSWAVQMLFDGTSGLVTDDNGRTENQISFVRGEWAEIRIDFDLDNNTISQYYNGAELASGTWAASGPVALGAIDLFSAGGSEVFYDDMSLSVIPTPATAALLGLGGLLAGRRRR